MNSGLNDAAVYGGIACVGESNIATFRLVHSLPTSGEQEDHNANATTAARHALDVLTNTQHVLAIELYTAARAMDLRLRLSPDANLGEGVLSAYRCIRQVVPYQPGDAWWEPEIERVKLLILDGGISV